MDHAVGGDDVGRHQRRVDQVGLGIGQGDAVGRDVVQNDGSPDLLKMEKLSSSGGGGATVVVV